MANTTISPYHAVANPPVDFLLTQYNPQLALPIDQSILKFSKEADLFVGKDEAERLKREENELFAHANQEKQLLLEELIKYRERRHSPQVAAPLVPNVKCSWDDVIVALKKLSKEGDDNDTKFKKSLRAIGDNAEIFQRWLKLLPDGDYGATVSGAFKILLGVSAAQRSSDVRTAAFEALSEIPDVIQHAASYTYIYTAMKPKRLIEKTAALCSAVLIALRHIVRYFGDGSFKRALGALSRGPTFKEDMIQSLTTVKKLAAEVAEEANICQQARLQNMTTNMEVMNHNASSTHLTIQQGFSHLQSEAYVQRIGEEVHKRVVNDLMLLLATHPAYDHRTGQLLCLPSGVRQVKSSDAILSSDSESRNETRNVISTSGLIRLLRPSRLVVGDDLHRLVNSGHSLNLRQMDRVKWMMTSSNKIREWLMSSRSRVLLINGNSSAIESVSPTTFLASRLLTTLERMRSVISIYYFCSLHTPSSREHESNGTGMLRCLLVQLLEAGKPWNLSFLSEDDLDNLDGADLEALRNLVHNLIKRLPEKTVLFCVIDAVNFYERDDTRDDFLAVIDQLVFEVERSRKITIKVLFTCHLRSVFVREYVDDEDVLLVPERVDGDGQGWSKFTWQRTMGRQIEELGSSRSERE
ncbi:hypothetical protein H2200_011277 [Cladophialophora chaetospira]|uniref:Nephrocystin 3-like N-terminal domain-containing protein n=1 Tax=Cladophialophora chaetospira TaxID=386627 RepID=A0AA38X0B1_9EURO|nr:hypothetical protein H2200_011277 [Cladophialophora chaetospira]